MAFFEGTPDGKGSHGELAQTIAKNGRQWALENVSLLTAIQGIDSLLSYSGDELIWPGESLSE